MKTEKFQIETEKLETVFFYKILFISRTFVTNRHQCQTAVDESEEPRLNGVNILIFFFQSLINIHEYAVERIS